MPFGFGGIARIGEGDLPSDNILGEHVRLGSTSVILSRTFKGVVGVDANAHPIDLKEEVDKVRSRMNEISSWGEAEHNANRERIVEAVDKLLFKVSQNVNLVKECNKIEEVSLTLKGLKTVI